MRPAYNYGPQYRVTMLTREDWTKATGAPHVVKGLVYNGGDRGWSLWAISGMKAQLFPRQICNSLSGGDIGCISLRL